MKNKILPLSLLLAMSQSSFANDSSEEIALLREQVQLLTERLNQLEAKSKTAEQEQKELIEMVETTSSSSSWADRMSYNADIRYRYEYIDQKEREIRQRNRIRLRAQFGMKVTEDFGFTLGLATGGDDPVSTNQSLDGAFSTKDVRLDLAYFNYNLNDEFTLIGGKMKNPFYRPDKNPVLWDGDLNPEGLAINYKKDAFQANIVGYSVEERSSADDTLMFGGQFMFTHKISDNVSLNSGLGYYDYRELKGNTPLYNGSSKGNTLDADGNLAFDFNLSLIHI